MCPSTSSAMSFDVAAGTREAVVTLCIRELLVALCIREVLVTLGTRKVLVTLWMRGAAVIYIYIYMCVCMPTLSAHQVLAQDRRMVRGAPPSQLFVAGMPEAVVTLRIR
jgi:hypothetical protein